MHYSMTGFGSGNASSEKIAVQIELRTLNNRHLDIRAKLPRSLFFWEPILREKISHDLRRGVVDIVANIQFLGDTLQGAIQEQTISSYVKIIKKIANSNSIADGLNVLSLLRLPGAMTDEQSFTDLQNTEQMQVLNTALEKALSQLIAMRAREGEKLVKAIHRELQELTRFCEEIKTIQSGSSGRVFEKLKMKIQKLLVDTKLGMDEPRLLQEVTYYAAKADITEELDRLHSHCKQFLQLLAKPSQAGLGKSLDFLTQELQREVNTIGAKTDELQITQKVLEMKTCIERMREQVQNLE